MKLRLYPLDTRQFLLHVSEQQVRSRYNHTMGFLVQGFRPGKKKEIFSLFKIPELALVPIKSSI